MAAKHEGVCSIIAFYWIPVFFIRLLNDQDPSLTALFHKVGKSVVSKSKIEKASRTLEIYEIETETQTSASISPLAPVAAGDFFAHLLMLRRLC